MSSVVETRNAASAAPSKRRVVSCRAVSSRSLSIIRCEQSAKKGGGPDTWLGRAAMVGFASAIAVEVATGKGFLQVGPYVTSTEARNERVCNNI